MADLWKLGAVELAAGIKAGDYTCVEVTESVLGRIEAKNPALNAIVFDQTEEARAQAVEADRAVAANEPLGPLHGVPVTIKENVDQVGTPTTNGVPAFADNVATSDAPVVRNLRNAGAIFVGRTNTPEFSMRGTTDNPLRGRTYNPWNEEASPGGSSGGAGAAAAAGFGPLHHGNDIGGSLRFPSFANGLVTVKPTTFRVPVYNPSAPAERGPLSQAMSCQGIIARHAADVALATEVLITPDPRDPNCPPLPWAGPPLDGPIRVAVTTESASFDLHPGIKALVERAAELLATAGYDVVEADPPPVVEPASAWFRTGSTELEALLDPAVQEYGSDDVKKVFSYFFAASEVQDRDGYMINFGDRTRMMRDWNLFLDRYPLIITPFLMTPLYRWDVDVQDYEQFKQFLDASIYSFGINYLGLPAGVIGMDLVEGLPAAVQIVGRRYREDVICDALGTIEEANGVLTHQLWERDGD
ncbi:MAG: amidase [Actinomycetia bacterium]|nr:amidase [Actinomycetes bacterium]MCP5031212.1 amidase [Actinomycetes bacterium]